MNTKYLPLIESENEIENITLDQDIIGIICYKVYDISFTKCYRDKEIIDKIKEKMQKYSNGEYEKMFNIDEDYVPKAKKRKKNIIETDKEIKFDFSSDSD